MLAFIFYVLMYFAIGFGFAKFKKYYDDLYNPEKISTTNYPLLGLVWLPYVGYWVIFYVISYVYEFYKSKL